MAKGNGWADEQTIIDTTVRYSIIMVAEVSAIGENKGGYKDNIILYSTISTFH